MSKELEAKYESCKREAQQWKQEAQTANATIAEIYQLVTGKTGEPGNWNGAKPVADLLNALAPLRDAPAGEPLSVREFQEWLNDRRSRDVAICFHDIVLRYAAALASPPLGAQPAAEPVGVSAVIDRNAVLEEAAKQCEDIYSWRGAYGAGVMHTDSTKACAAAIRSLKGRRPALAAEPRTQPQPSPEVMP